MSPHDLDRRQFHQLTTAALSGILAGSMIGCGGDAKEVGKAASSAANAADRDKHLCRGLNDCKGQGVSGMNDCRGQGDCATVAHHDCGTHNTCKGLGGCGATAGANDCAGKGGCRVPLMDGAWETVRQRMEGKWTSSKVEFGKAPAPKM